MYLCRYRILSLGNHIKFNTHSNTADMDTHNGRGTPWL